MEELLSINKSLLHEYERGSARFFYDLGSCRSAPSESSYNGFGGLVIRPSESSGQFSVYSGYPIEGSMDGGLNCCLSG